MRELIDDVVIDRPRLENAPLKAVICQVKVPRQLRLSDDEVAPIQRALSERYPLLREEHAVELTIEAAPSPQALLTPSGVPHRVFRFLSKDQDWTATVGPEAISLETTAYTGMRDFLIRWAELAGAAGSTLGLAARERIGLRYINELPCPGATREALRGWVRDELVMLIGAHERRTARLSRMMSQAQFHQPDGCTCNIRHGIGPNGEAGESPELLFLLDFDYFSDEVADFDVEQQIRSLASFNDGIYELFEWSFLPAARESFGPELHPA